MALAGTPNTIDPARKAWIETRLSFVASLRLVQKDLGQKRYRQVVRAQKGKSQIM